MGKGKGEPDHWVAVVKSGTVMFEVAGLPAEILFKRTRVAIRVFGNDHAAQLTQAVLQLLAEHRIRHLLIAKRRPQTNSKVERYQQTLKREWALGQIYRSSEHRGAALSHWLQHYNTRRPHSALDGRPPISRVHNLPRQDI